jgi:uncharacterized repeat protein (TIGR03803 family)
MHPTANIYSEALVANRSERRNRFGSQTWVRSRMAILIAAAWLVSLCARDAQAQPAAFFQSLYSFTNGSDGVQPYANLIPSGATLYGTTTSGGTNGSGTVFAFSTNGMALRTIYSFTGLVYVPNDPYAAPTNTDGANPTGGLVLSGNSLYGTAQNGGTIGVGTVFAVDTDGTGFRVLHTFPGITFDGWNPCYGLTLSSNRLYGAVYRGGTNNNGIVFACNIDGSGYSILHLFEGVPDGEAPQCSLVLSGDALYGTTLDGGTNDAVGGTVFAVNTNGTTFNTLHAFSPILLSSPPTNSDGANPLGSLVLFGNTLYGTTPDGGTNGSGTVFAVNTDGTDFMVLHTFSTVTGYNANNDTWTNLDGATPAGGLVLSGNTLYGTASEGGTNACGTVFAVNIDGTGFMVTHTFNGSDGAGPQSSLLLSGNTLYGTTVLGGTGDGGTIFAITLPSIPTIASNSVVAIGGQLQFEVCGLTPGATVYVQASSNLSPSANWVSVATNATTGTNLTISGLSVTNANYRFFRVMEISPP